MLEIKSHHLTWVEPYITCNFDYMRLKFEGQNTTNGKTTATLSRRKFATFQGLNLIIT